MVTYNLLTTNHFYLRRFLIDFELLAQNQLMINDEFVGFEHPSKNDHLYNVLRHIGRKRYTGGRF